MMPKPHVPEEGSPHDLTDLQFQVFLENAQDVIYIYRIHPTRRYEYVSPSCQLVFGYPPEAFYADPDLLLKISHPDDRQQIAETWRELARLPRRLTRRWVHPDGRIIWTENVNSAVLDAEGRVVAIHGIARDITERRRAEEAAGHLAAIVQQSQHAVYRIGLDGTVGFWNEGAERLYGYSASEMVGRSIAEIFPPDDRQLASAMLARVTRGETIEEQGAKGLRKDGVTIRVAVTWSPIWKGGTQIVGASAIALDVTERELAHRYNEQLGEISDVIHSTLDPELVMQNVLEQAARALGSETAAISLREADGWRLRYVLGFDPAVIGTRMDDDQERHAVLAIASGEPVAIDDARSDERVNHEHMARWNIRSVLVVPMRVGEGVMGAMYYNYHTRPFHFSDVHISFAKRLASSLALALSNAQLYQRLAAELADRKRIQQERADLLIREQAARLRAEETALRMSRLVAVISAVSNTLDRNQVARAVLEHGLAALNAQAGAITLLSDDRSTVETIDYIGYPALAVEPVRRHSLSEPFVTSEAIRTGKAIWLESGLELVQRYPSAVAFIQSTNLRAFAAIPLFANGRPVGALAVQFDRDRRFSREDREFMVTLAEQCGQALDRARLYEAEARARLQAEDAVRLRDHFFHVAAHELRNPLTTLMGYSELLAMPDALGNPERARRGLETIHQQTVRLDKMIGALLDVSRIVEGRFHLNRALFDLSQLATRVADESRLSTHKHSITLDLPDAPLIVYGDEMRLEQMMRNLLGNAIKYTIKGGPITVTARRCDRDACLSVEDCGIGIPADALPRLFDRFYRAPNAEAQHVPGLGIGLFVIKEIVAQHGGIIEVQSTEGKGTTFTVKLPLAKD